MAGSDYSVRGQPVHIVVLSTPRHMCLPPLAETFLFLRVGIAFQKSPLENCLYGNFKLPSVTIPVSELWYNYTKYFIEYIPSHRE